VDPPEDLIEPARLRVLAAEGAAMGLDELVAYALGSADPRVPPDHGPAA
jgi:hypothetical protein